MSDEEDFHSAGEEEFRSDDIISVSTSCGSCGSSTGPLAACRSCKSVSYCNVACQKAHWKDHRKECREKSENAQSDEPEKTVEEKTAADDNRSLNTPASNMWQDHLLPGVRPGAHPQRINTDYHLIRSTEEKRRYIPSISHSPI